MAAVEDESALPYFAFTLVDNINRREYALDGSRNPKPLNAPPRVRPKGLSVRLIMYDGQALEEATAQGEWIMIEELKRRARPLVEDDPSFPADLLDPREPPHYERWLSIDQG